MAASESLASRFSAKCDRMQGSVDFSMAALSDLYQRQLARDAQIVEALKDDVRTLQMALSRLDADVRPQLDRLGLALQLPQPPKVALVKAPTTAEQAAATLVQQRWRGRRPRIMAGTHHCPALLRRRFVEGAFLYDSPQHYGNGKDQQLASQAQSDALPHAAFLEDEGAAAQ